MKKQLNHSRYIDNGAKDIGDNAYYYAKSTPTAKQVKFYKKLYALCKENGIDAITQFGHSRTGLAMTIDALIARLKEHNVDVNGNGKQAGICINIGTDGKGRDYVRDKIVICAGEEAANES